MNKTLLVILDGWGIAVDKSRSAIEKAKTPVFDSLINNHANSYLSASGLDVGLPEGQMGNSEVGHMNLGAGRVVYQDLVKINLAVDNKSLNKEPELVNAFEYAKNNNKPIHFIGLVSDGGVHSHIYHLKGLMSAAQEAGLQQVYIHAFLDGRDTDPKSGMHFLSETLQHAKNTGAKLASVIGRYYAMDRDKRWERIKLAYDLLTSGKGTPTTDALTALSQSYEAGITDEFVRPIVCVENNKPTAIIKDGDVVINFNFRTDRGRQITQALTQQAFPEQDMHPLKLYYVTLTCYDETFKDVKVIYNKDNLSLTMGEVLANADKTQIRIAETEKYPHVTFFFSGGREEPFKGERRILIPSPKVATYDLKPEMSAYELTEQIVPELAEAKADFVCLNFANPDMVGHTGVFEAAVKAVETVDECLGKVLEAAQKGGYYSVVIADHGNADIMLNEDGSPNTAHTTNLVPFIVVAPSKAAPQITQINPGKLGDIAPTLLKIMGIAQPKEMTGTPLVTIQKPMS
jgi:2,3-bisphosphoglycerate-independent phosphoglycerate mutase